MTQKALLQSAGDGTAVPSGYIGQVLQTTQGVTATLGAAANLTSLSVTPGVWLLTAEFSVLDTAGASNYYYFGISTNSGSFTGTTRGYNYAEVYTLASVGKASGSLLVPVVVSTTTTYYLVASSPQGTTVANAGAGTLTAIRIA